MMAANYRPTADHAMAPQPAAAEHPELRQRLVAAERDVLVIAESAR